MVYGFYALRSIEDCTIHLFTHPQLGLIFLDLFTGSYQLCITRILHSLGCDIDHLSEALIILQLNREPDSLGRELASRGVQCFNVGYTFDRNQA